jgi:hypothetical protein
MNARVMKISGLVCLMVMAVSAALADEPPAVVPETSAMSLFASGGAAAFALYAVRKWFKRK